MATLAVSTGEGASQPGFLMDSFCEWKRSSAHDSRRGPSASSDASSENIERLKARFLGNFNNPGSHLFKNQASSTTPRDVHMKPHKTVNNLDLKLNERGFVPYHSNTSSLPTKTQKIPRPPNAFILYRQHYHPIVRAQNPHFHNNDISKILGAQWRRESAQKKGEYKALAEQLKRKHAHDHPDYQYAPRKPSERKRRKKKTVHSKPNDDIPELSPLSEPVPLQCPGTPKHISSPENFVRYKESDGRGRNRIESDCTSRKRQQPTSHLMSDDDYRTTLRDTSPYLTYQYGHCLPEEQLSKSRRNAKAPILSLGKGSELTGWTSPQTFDVDMGSYINFLP